MADGHGEIIIIKRHGDHEEGHHGGAWKIALADFMTAMMALFLVMWLINSTSKEQKQTIAEYFNPVKLAEVTHDRKGLRDPQDAPAEAGAEGGKAETKGEGKDARGTKGSDATGVPGGRTREFALFQDPYAVLARLAGDGERGAETSSADAAVLERGQPGISGGEAARDPFDPLYWQLEALPGHRTEQPGATDTVTAPPADRRIDARSVDRPAVTAAEAKQPDGKPPDAKAPESRAAARGRGREGPAGVKLASAEPLAQAAPVAQAAAREAEAGEAVPGDLPLDTAKAPEPGGRGSAKAPGKAVDTTHDPKAAESAALAALKAEVAAAVQPLANGAPAPRIEVRRTGEGILISVTDDVNFSMFSVGSAEPMPKVVRALERVARVVATRPGRLVIRGHTDSRPFRSETYDNWRLSSARAQMASYMLVRGGVDEARFERIEGHADRQPRNAADTKAAENRRIEILLRGQPE